MPADRPQNIRTYRSQETFPQPTQHLSSPPTPYLKHNMTTIPTEEGWLETADGHKLYTKTWKADSPKARLVFIHGFSDHCNTHDEPLFPTLAAQHGIEVCSFDQRGWGRSVHENKHKGLTGPTPQVMDDITAFIKSLPATNMPMFLMGHSMGGAEVIVYTATGPKDVLSKFRGFLVESPFIALHKTSRPWKSTVILGRLAGRLMPHVHMVNKLDPKKIARDPKVAEEFLADPLCHETGTLEGLAGMLDRAADIEEGRIIVKEGAGEGGKTRMWVGHGTADEICAYDACKNWYESVKVEDKQMRAYEGWYHKLHSEPGEDKMQFTNEVAKWMLDRSGPLDEVDAGSKAKL